MDTTSASTNRKTIRQFIRKRWRLVAINFKVLVIWSICEIVLCSLVICVKQKDHPENFLHNLCDENWCDNFLEVALYGRLTLSFLSLLGILIVSQFFLYLAYACNSARYLCKKVFECMLCTCCLVTVGKNVRNVVIVKIQNNVDIQDGVRN